MKLTCSLSLASLLCVTVPAAADSVLQTGVWGGLRQQRLNDLLGQAYELEKDALAFTFPDPAKGPYVLENGQGQSVSMSLTVSVTGKPVLSAMGPDALAKLEAGIRAAGDALPGLVPQDGRTVPIPSNPTVPNIKPFVRASFLVQLPVRATLSMKGSDGKALDATVDFTADLLFDLLTRDHQQTVAVGALARYLAATTSDAFASQIELKSSSDMGALRPAKDANPLLDVCATDAACSCDIAQQLAMVATFVTNNIAMPAMANRLAAHLNAVSIFNMRTKVFDFSDVTIGQDPGGTFMRFASILQAVDEAQKEAVTEDPSIPWADFEGSANDYYACISAESLTKALSLQLASMPSTSIHGNADKGWCKCTNILIGNVCVGGGWNAEFWAGLGYTFKSASVLDDGTIRMNIDAVSAGATVEADFCAGVGGGETFKGMLELDQVHYDCKPTFVPPGGASQGKIEFTCGLANKPSFRIDFNNEVVSIVQDILSAVHIWDLVSDAIDAAVSGFFHKSEGVCVGMRNVSGDTSDDPTCTKTGPYHTYVSGFEVPTPRCIELTYQPQTMTFTKGTGGELCVTGTVSAGATFVDGGLCAPSQ